MNAVVLALAIAAVGVDYQVETTADKQQQYTIQIEPEILKLVGGGEEIHSEVPPDAGPIQRLCIRIGMTRPQHSPASEAAFRQLLVSASRWASADRALTAADAPPTILWPARSNPEPTYGLRYGWQPDADGKQSYYVQIDPTVLRTLVAGDEVYAPIDPAAGRPNRFVISLTQKELPPRIAAAGGAAVQPAFQPGGQTPIGQATDLGNRSQFPAAGGGFAGGSSPPPATGRGGEFSTFTPTDIPQAPGAFQSGSADYSRQSPRLTPPTTAPPLTDNRGNAFNPAASGGGYSPAPIAGYGASPTLEPPRTSFGAAAPPTSPPANYYPQPPATAPPLQVADSRGYGPAEAAGSYSPAASGSYASTAPYSPPTDNRLATLPQPPLASATPTGSTVVPPAAAPQKEGWGIFVVVLFALFFSIGGNLYLAWTALEFHNRYRSAIDRLRSAARSA